ncbi:Eco57I restriction-modification methylase domain-containing protein, partial [Methanothrix sp.]|uniref:Eco57I restriction-modification methylase domain-containing protein n=1 Tax=Methanothrix sp. TaxID=90426 RepID=UPI003983506F
MDRIVAASEILNSIRDDSPRDVEEKKRQYEEQRRAAERLRTACDIWTAAFFQHLDRSCSITTATLRGYLRSGDASPEVEHARALAASHRFFHWPLEFPEVFENGGFDVVLGNPPWERIKLQEQEFFATRDPEIANAPNAAARKRLIRRLPETKPELWEEYKKALHAAESTSRFLRGSGMYPLTGRGRINTYSVFAERMRGLLRTHGRAGIIVPSGIATDDTNKHFFADLVDRRELVSLFDFENREKLFSDVDSRYKFSLLTMARGSGGASPELAFFATRAEHLRDHNRRFRLSSEEIALINPNTRTLPVFRTRQDAELTRAIYERVPVLVNERTGENPWGVRFLAIFHMTNDSHLFRTREQLESDGFRMVGNMFVRGDEVYLPLYEAKMFHFYDHRFADMESGGEIDGRYEDPAWLPLPRYWVSDRDVKNIIKDRSHLLGYRNITNTTNERTFIGSVLPPLGAGNSINIVFTDRNHLGVCMLSNMNTFCFDFVARQKVGGTNFSHFILKQLPVIPPDAYNHDLVRFIVPRVLELTYTSW